MSGTGVGGTIHVGRKESFRVDKVIGRSYRGTNRMKLKGGNGNGATGEWE